MDGAIEPFLEGTVDLLRGDRTSRGRGRRAGCGSGGLSGVLGYGEVIGLDLSGLFRRGLRRWGFLLAAAVENARAQCREDEGASRMCHSGRRSFTGWDRNN